MRKLVKKLLIPILLGIALLYTSIGLTQTHQSASEIQKNINRIIASSDTNVNIGIQVQSVTDGRMIYRRNADRLFVPASNLKLFTAIAGLDYLKPNFQFRTQLLSAVYNSQRGVLESNLYVKFSGDPTLETKDLDDLIAQLAEKNIHIIAGNLIIDDTAFGKVHYGPGWMWDELNFDYSAPIGAIIIDQNSFRFRLTPGRKTGQPTQVVNVSNHPFALIINGVNTKIATKDECPLELEADKQNVYHLTGCLAPGGPPKNFAVSIKNTRLYSQNVLTTLLEKHHIKLIGKVQFSQVPKNAIPLATHNSQPLNEMIIPMLKDSDNLIANAIYKKLGETYYNKPGTWENSSRALQEILINGTKIDFKKTSIVDGAGLSRYNLVTPEQMEKLLFFAYRNPAIRPDLLAALPIGGIDGSLEGRLRDISVRGKIHAKTGTMKSVSALAGYINTHHHETLAFVIIVNEFLGSAHKYRVLEDKIVTFLANT